jgi:hypothetical protein
VDPGFRVVGSDHEFLVEGLYLVITNLDDICGEADSDSDSPRYVYRKEFEKKIKGLDHNYYTCWIDSLKDLCGEEPMLWIPAIDDSKIRIWDDDDKLLLLSETWYGRESC